MPKAATDLQPPSQLTTPADSELFYRRDDPNDIRLGEKVMLQSDEYGEAEVVLVGCPQDDGVARNRGRTGARLAPTEIRRALYRYPVSDLHLALSLFDLGDVSPRDTLEATHDDLQQVVTQLLTDGKKVVVIGGGNDISYPDCSALAAVSKQALILNIDRHLDVRADSQRNSGTPYRQLLEEQKIDPRLFHEIGINSFANSPAYCRYLEELGVSIHYLGDLREQGVGAAVRAVTAAAQTDGIFYGFDLDVVRAVEAPGVSDPSPMGLTAREVCEIADVAAGDPRTRIIELSEVNPVHDVNGITSRLAANIIMRALAAPG